MIRCMLLSIALLLPVHIMAAEQPADMQVHVSRDGSQYDLTASFDTTLSQCAAYQYLTDYDAAKLLPGVIKSSAVRESDHTVKVDRVADEQVLFFNVRIRSVMEYTEKPLEGVTFTQLDGDSKLFRGNWTITPIPSGSRLTFNSIWVPDTVIPLFVIDHFAKNGLIKRFSAIANLAEQRKALETSRCAPQQLASGSAVTQAGEKGL